uniref:Myb-like domain-containing protein n=1 Tax=Oryza barthii TaxID=65489 RepID=A0A0D3H613_9ORYZ
MESFYLAGVQPPTKQEEEYLSPVAADVLTEDKVLGETGRWSGSLSKRWPRQETLALLQIRSEMDGSFRDATLWEEISSKLSDMGYVRSAQMCKEKYEEVQRYKRSKDGCAGKQDMSDPEVEMGDEIEEDRMVKPEVGGGIPFSVGKRKRDDGGSNALLEGFMKQVMERQEEMQRRFLEALEKREAERAAREEAWRGQVMDRLNREHEQLAAIIAILRHTGDGEQHLHPPVVPTLRLFPHLRRPVPLAPLQMRPPQPKHDVARTPLGLHLTNKTKRVKDEPSPSPLFDHQRSRQKFPHFEEGPHGQGSPDLTHNTTVRQIPDDYTTSCLPYLRFLLEAAIRGIYNLIRLGECRVHNDDVANLLHQAKDAVYCAEDLLDELNYYELQDEIEHNANPSARPEYSDINIRAKEVHGKINYLVEQMGYLGLNGVRLEQFMFESKLNYSNLTYEETVIGRREELQLLIDTLVLRKNSLTGRIGAGGAEVPGSDRARPENLSILPIVGEGGVGKTALAHCAFNHNIVQNHFDLHVWICVSDGFDNKKLTKKLAWSAAENKMKLDDLSCLQRIITNGIIHHSTRFLLVIDDLQEDVGQENYIAWERFLAPLKCARAGSMVLVTTRSLEVAEHIGTMNPLQLEGLPEEIIWHLFSMYAFELPISDSNQAIDFIGRKISSRLNGSPLGAKILGCLLNLKLDLGYWKNILESKLWEIDRQNETRIWPALQLSYQYLPFHLKRCFSFCSLYPKGHEFDAETLVDSWVAVGLVVSRGSVPAVDIGHEYFDQLVRRSFFQISPTSSSSRYAYVMQGLLYETAQKISTNECFVIKHSSDLLRIPPKVRHVSILHFSGLSSSDLESLHKYSTLQSVVCTGIDSDVLTTSVLEIWFCHLTNIRMLRFISCQLKELPGNVGNLILLRYLDISSCDFEALPDSFWRLRKLEILDAQNCGFHDVPKDIVKLVNLTKIRLKGDLINQLGHIPGVGKLVYLEEMPYYAVGDTPGRRIEELKNMNHLRGALEISGLHNVTSKETAAGAGLDKKIHLDTLTISWHDSIRPDKHNSLQEMEVLEGLRPSPTIKNLEVRFYMGSGFHPSWLLHGVEDQWLLGHLCGEVISRLESLSISSCPNITNLLVVETSSSSSRSSSPEYRSLTKLCITWCRKLRSLDNLIRSWSLPNIRVIRISNCEKLSSLPFVWQLAHLEDLEVSHCWSLSWERGLILPSSLKSLKLEACGELTDSALSCGLRGLPVLATLELQFCSGLESFDGETWSGMPSLRRLKIFCCQELSSIGGAESIARVESVDIRHCPKLMELEQPFQRG